MRARRIFAGSYIYIYNIYMAPLAIRFYPSNHHVYIHDDEETVSNEMSVSVVIKALRFPIYIDPTSFI